MRGALIEDVRARFQPAGVYVLWPAVTGATPSERFLRSIILRWEKATDEMLEGLRKLTESRRPDAESRLGRTSRRRRRRAPAEEPAATPDEAKPIPRSAEAEAQQRGSTPGGTRRFRRWRPARRDPGEDVEGVRGTPSSTTEVPMPPREDVEGPPPASRRSPKGRRRVTSEFSPRQGPTGEPAPSGPTAEGGDPASLAGAQDHVDSHPARSPTGSPPARGVEGHLVEETERASRISRPNRAGGGPPERADVLPAEAASTVESTREAPRAGERTAPPQGTWIWAGLPDVEVILLDRERREKGLEEWERTGF